MLQSKILLVLLLLCAGFASGQNQDQTTYTPDFLAAGGNNHTAELSNILNAEYVKFSTEKVPADSIFYRDSVGLLIGLVQENGLSYVLTKGSRELGGKPLTKDTIFRIGSLSKTFTGTATAILSQQGKIHYHQPVEHYVKNLKVQYLPNNHFPITVKHLFTHSSGISAPIPHEASIEDSLMSINATPLEFRPGRLSAYSNSGIALLGMVIASVSQTTYENFVQGYILDPMGMKSTYFHESEISDKERMAKGYDQIEQKWVEMENLDLQGLLPAGGIYSTLEDLSKYMVFQWAGNESVLHGDVLDDMHQVKMSAHSSLGAFYGVTWNIKINALSGDKIVKHGGTIGGYKTAFVFDSTRKLGVIILANTGGFDGEHLGERIIGQMQKYYQPIEAKSLQDKVRQVAESMENFDTYDINSLYTDSLITKYGGRDRFVGILKLFKNQYGKIVEVGEVKQLDFAERYTAMIKFESGQRFLAIFGLESHLGKLNYLLFK